MQSNSFNAGTDDSMEIRHALEGINLDNSRNGGSNNNNNNNDYLNSKSDHNPRLGSIPLQPGEFNSDDDIHNHYERPLSAPPPPGFGEGKEERDRIVNEALNWGHIGSNSSDNGSKSDNRNSSISSLVAVLGKGLAETIESATLERSQSASPGEDLNLHRQTRHTASRLIAGNNGSHQHSSNYQHSNSTGMPAYMDLFSGGSNNNNTNNGSNAGQFRQPMTSDSFNRSLGTSDSLQGMNDNDKHGSYGFPSSLSTPARSKRAEKEQALQNGGSTTPVQMFASQIGRALQSKHIGMAINEPGSSDSYPAAITNLSDFGSNLWGGSREFVPLTGNNQSGLAGTGASSVNSNANSSGGFREFTPLNNRQAPQVVPNLREFVPSNNAQQSNFPGGTSSFDQSAAVPDQNNNAVSELSSRQAEAELQPFLWDTNSNHTSRTLAILRCSWLRVPDVRTSCENYGALKAFRAEFSNVGVFFVSYYDIRSAQFAAVELEAVLQRLAIQQGSNESVLVRYCLPLDAKNQLDETKISISDLPEGTTRSSLSQVLSSYGTILSIVSTDHQSYKVEYQNVQDTKTAMSELENTQPYGSNVIVEESVRDSNERKRGRELDAVLRKWRQAMNARPSGNGAQRQGTNFNPGFANDSWRQPNQRPDQFNRPQEAPQFVMGPNGRYMQVAVPQQSYQRQPQQQTQQRYLQDSNGQVFVVTVPVHHGNHAYLPSNSAVQQAFPASAVPNHRYDRRDSRNNYIQVVSDASSVGGLSGRSYRSSQSSYGGEDRDLKLDLDAVEHGLDTRTSLMVRNIPNKYTQQMLLNEFIENGHGPGVIDFFYLPIDFKNHCNRGYAFINFVDHQDILPFHRRYYGKHWRTFNSDKICDITYARIQGKAAMLNRFENSALMSKEEEYKPLVFQSDGPDRGRQLPFPDPSNRMP